MEEVARRYAIAAAALTAVGVVTVAPVAAPPLHDRQVRAAELVANVVDLHDAQINALYEHIQQEFSGNTDIIQHSIGPGDLFAGDQGIGFGDDSPTLNLDDLGLSENAVTNLIGGGLDPAALQESPFPGFNPADSGVFDANTPGGLFSANEGVNAVANLAAISVVNLVPAAQAVYQTFTDGVVATELALNAALVDAQQSAASELTSGDGVANDFLNWMIGANNAALAQQEITLNNLLGANFDPDAIHGSLVSAFNAEGFTVTDWAVLLGISPAELSQAVQAIDGGTLLSMLTGGIDWAGFFPGLF